MSDLNQAILDELRAIRTLLAAKPVASAAPAAAQQAPSATPDGPPPQPVKPVENAANVTVHFGKNNGVALGALTERQLGFYASVKAPRLDNSGKPFPPRPQDVALEQAARTLWHERNRTLTVGVPNATAPATQSASLDEDVPF